MADQALALSVLLASSALTSVGNTDEVPRTIYSSAVLDFFPHYREVISTDELSGGECLARAAVLSSLIHTDPDLALQSGKSPMMGACLNKTAYLAAKLQLGSAGIAAATQGLRPSQIMQGLVAQAHQQGFKDIGFAYTCNPKDYPVDAAKLAITAQRMLRAQESVALPVDRAAAARVCKVTAGQPVAPAGYVTGTAQPPEPVPLPKVDPARSPYRPPCLI